jgi:uncharacterized protein YprB with RNaseH-like and TPR domain
MLKHNKRSRILFWDIETYGMNFNADAGFIMVISYKWKGETQVHTITRSNPSRWSRKLFDDKEICRAFAKVLESADLHVTWNGTRFDVPFLQTRMLKHRLGYLPPIPHEDGLRTARRSLKMRRSLDNVQKFFELGTKKEDMNLTKVWMPAAMGDPVALRQVIKRCESDVKLLEEAYDLLAPLSTVHPNVGIIEGRPDGCPLCGVVGHLQKRGRIHALRHYRHRFQCTKCGRWSTSGPVKTGAR